MSGLYVALRSATCIATCRGQILILYRVKIFYEDSLLNQDSFFGQECGCAAFDSSSTFSRSRCRAKRQELKKFKAVDQKISNLNFFRVSNLVFRRLCPGSQVSKSFPRHNPRTLDVQRFTFFLAGLPFFQDLQGFRF